MIIKGFRTRHKNIIVQENTMKKTDLSRLKNKDKKKPQ